MAAGGGGGIETDSSGLSDGSKCRVTRAVVGGRPRTRWQAESRRGRLEAGTTEA